MKKILLTMLAVALAMGFAAQSYAATATATMNASVNVAGTGTISSANLNLGSGVTPGNQSTGNTTITVNVSTDVIYDVTLDAGTHASGGVRRIQMSGNSTDFPTYYLYKDSAMTQEWGDSNFSNTYSAGASYQTTGTGSNQTLTIYGKGISTAGQSSGTYTDTVTATLNY